MALPFGLTADQIFTAAFNRIEIRTALSPPVVIDPSAPPDPQTQELLQYVQPAIILNGPAGQYQIAPYGIPEGISPDAIAGVAKTGLGTLLGLGGVVLLLAAWLR